MNYFECRNGELWAEEVRVSELAGQFGTPLYIYSTKTLKRHYRAFDNALGSIDHLTCFSVKANSNVNLLRLLGGYGAGMDIVSGGELYRALAAGVDPHKIVFSGVGKQDHEIKEALEAGILMFNVESSQELERIGAIAQQMNTVARVSIRINPNVDPNTHPYISTGLKKTNSVWISWKPPASIPWPSAIRHWIPWEWIVTSVPSLPRSIRLPRPWKSCLTLPIG